MRRSSRRAASVRMLCRRSASLMTMTRMSLDMATNILRMVAACSSVRDSTSMRVILVTPSTSARTCGLKVRSTSSARHLRVLHGVVEQRRRDGLGVHAQIGQDDAHLDGMDDERLAGLAALARVSGAGELEGTAQHGLLRRVHVRARQAREFGEAVLGRGGPALDGRIGRGMRTAQKRVHRRLGGLPGADGIGRGADGIVSLDAHGRLPSP